MLYEVITQRPLKWLLPDLLDADNLMLPSETECEVEGFHRNGALLQLSARVSVMQVGSRRLYTCMVADITRRKATEDRLRDAENRYRDLVDRITSYNVCYTKLLRPFQDGICVHHSEQCPLPPSAQFHSKCALGQCRAIFSTGSARRTSKLLLTRQLIAVLS